MRTTTRYFALLAFCLISIAVLYVFNENMESKRIAKHRNIRKRLGIAGQQSLLEGAEQPELVAGNDYIVKQQGESVKQTNPMKGITNHHIQPIHKNHSKITPNGVAHGGSDGECAPKHNIIFTKVHKSGSSTVQNILLRYGDRHNLIFVLPPRGHHLGYPNYFDKNQHMLHTSDEVYNIFCHHARFSPDVIEIMPKDSVSISILRDPVDVFESAFTYFKMDYRMGAIDDPQALTNFLSNPRRYVEQMRSAVHTRNNMLFDFGVPAEIFDDEVELQSAIDKISERFTLILMGDYFEESLILLRDLLCWRTEDVVVFRMNARNENSVQRLTATDSQRIKDWNKGDVMLYHHFNQTLWKKIDSFGREKMAREVEKLKKLTDKYFRDCVESDQAKSRDAEFKVWQPKGVQINGFILKEQAKGNPVCERMVKPEMQYTEELRQKQFGINRRKNQRLQPAVKNNPRFKIW